MTLILFADAAKPNPTRVSSGLTSSLSLRECIGRCGQKVQRPGCSYFGINNPTPSAIVKLRERNMLSPSQNVIGEQVRKLRCARELTQETLAAKRQCARLGFKPGHVSQNRSKCALCHRCRAVCASRSPQARAGRPLPPRRGITLEL